MKRLLLLSGGVLLGAIAGCAPKTQTESADGTNGATAQVIELTQTGCQFLETESKDYKFVTERKANCEKINADTLAERQAGFKPLSLKPGKYIFRVTNQNVPYDLGFYLRGDGEGKGRLPKVSGGGLKQGVTKDYEITLKPGKYVFSCPLNPTPDYPVVVQ